MLKVTYTSINIARHTHTVHAAIIAINEAIDREIAVETTASLRNEAANLVNISDALTDTYQRVLKDAKVEKLQAAIFKVRSYV